MTTYIPNLTLPEAVFNNPAISILFPITLGTVVGYSTRPEDTKRTYDSWKQPPPRPPAWVFGPVWTTLYGMMGYAAYRAVHNGTSPFNSPATIALTKQTATLYTIQLGLNLAWMPLFFGLRRPVEATLDVFALLGINSYLAYTWATAIDQTAGLLLLPYVAWLGFASYLSFGTGYLNGWDLRDEALGVKKNK